MTSSMAPPVYELSHLGAPEAEAVHIFREVAATFERPVLLFSGGKDSVVMLHVAAKAFWPAPVPFAVMHVDTGHNFDEVIEFRDRTVERLGLRLVVARVQDDIDAGRVSEETGARASRNRLQTAALLRAITDNGFDAVFGGARRDEEKARAKERIFSFRDEFGQWEPRAQRPELWSLYNGRHRKGEHIRVFPLSNWTELDIWQYISEEGIDLPRSTTHTAARWCPATECSLRVLVSSHCCPATNRTRRSCGSGPSATPPVRGASNPRPPPPRPS